MMPVVMLVLGQCSRAATVELEFDIKQMQTENVATKERQAER